MVECIALLILSVAVAIATGSCQSGDSRVVNGTDAAEGAYPFMVRVVVFGGVCGGVCGGSIINPSWILTAAHCVLGVKPSNIGIIYGFTDSSSKEKLGMEVNEVITHKDQKLGPHLKDIALLKLVKPLSFEMNRVSSVSLPEKDYEVPENSDVILMGWGLNETGGVRPNRLQEVILKVYPNTECLHLSINSYELCYGLPFKGQCSGDSGGPIIFKKGSEFVQIGIVSKSQKPCASKPAVSTKVSHFIDWIMTHIK